MADGGVGYVEASFALEKGSKAEVDVFEHRVVVLIVEPDHFEYLASVDDAVSPRSQYALHVWVA
jgi:hypothetical protein